MAGTKRSKKALLVEMFDLMVKRKDDELISHYYHREFLLTTNGQVQGYEDFAAGHRRVYATSISYDVRYDDESWVVTDDRIAVRLWITTCRPGEDATEIEVVLVATWLDERIHRLWELTWPDWTQVRALGDYAG